MIATKEKISKEEVEEIKEGPKNRESNFELLRIITMIMIIFFHLAVHSGFNFDPTDISINRLWIQFNHFGGKMGVNIFVLISGYFLINSKKIKISRILKLWGQIIFTSMSIYTIFVLLGLEKFDFKVIKLLSMPITNETWWFASSYFVLYIISPYINIILNKIDKATYKKMLCFMFLAWCIIPTFTDRNFQSNNLVWFVFLYSLAGYIKLYSDNWKMNNKQYFGIAILLILLVVIGDIYADVKSMDNILVDLTDMLYMFNLPTFLVALFIFLGFKETNIRYDGAINKIASTTFGIYLLHDSAYTQPLIWRRIFKVATFQESNILIPYSISVCFLVFFIGVLIELIRIGTVEKWYMKLIYKIERKIKNRKMLKD